jgi:chromosome segregation protein
VDFIRSLCYIARMLRLERLEVSGFKSFFERAELSFPGSMTAVIGPNGCGKSNICDAVAWVLGEQSARILRGDTMDDVIFSGSAKRRPLGMAEVTLTLRSKNGDFPESEGMVRIGRRVYRDGEGEYFLNDKRVRLKDVQDVLFGTGLGVRAYSIIEQGKIDQVLSSKPQDRRKLIEEAAGITRYKVKKRAAELKLEETRANLTRLSDIVAEVERACNSLKRQASKAQRYRERTGELRDKRMILARLKFDLLSAESERALQALQARRDEEAGASADLATHEAEEAEIRRVSIDARNRREAARERLSAATSAVERDDASIEGARRAETEIAARRETVIRHREELDGESARRAEQRDELQSRLERCRSEAAAAEGDAGEVIRLKTQAEEDLFARETALDAARSELASLSAESAQSRNARHEIDLVRERVGSTRTRLRESRDRLVSSLASLAEELSSAQEAELHLRALAEDRAARVRDNERLRAELERELAGGEAERARLREELAAVENRARALGQVQEARERGAESAAAALEKAGLATHGVLAARLKPRPGWEEALDRLAGEELGALLVEADASDAAARLKAAGLAAALVGLSWEGSRPASAWQDVLENYADLPASLTACLPEVVFVENAEEARDGARRHPERLFAARTGDIVRGSLWRVPGERTGAEGFLTLRRELGQARERLSVLAAEVATCETGLEITRARRVECDSSRAALEEARRAAEAEATAHAARTAERREDHRRRVVELETLEAEDAMLAEEGRTLQIRNAQALAEEARLAALEDGLRDRTASLTSEIAGLRGELARATEREATARARREGARERLASAEREWALVGAQEETASRKKNELADEARLLTERLETAGREAVEARARRDRNVELREKAAREFETLSFESESRALAATEAEEAVKRVRAIFEEARQKRFEAEIMASRLTTERGHSVEDGRREFGVSPEELPAAAPLAEAETTALEESARELADQIEKMGPVNVLAFEEHREQSERLEFLTAQRRDLEDSIASLMDTIRKINATSSERFAEAFARINANFAEIFQRLFRGGTAEMRLLDENDVLDSGIEISAQPPGKRNQSILLLSGGEKAMTAIALLMAIFRYKPSPFCILDEVDAPLDDANIDRFTRLIRDMAEETQFIAITHNKRTMETADALYGVTMEEPGCSKIVSVRFD